MSWLLYKKPGYGTRLRWINHSVAMAGIANGSLKRYFNLYRTVQSAPVNTLLPVVAGPMIVGGILVATNGGWVGGGLTYAYKWYGNGVLIAGATAKQYTLTATELGKMITVEVTATNTFGNENVTSAPVGPVIGLPVNSSPPAITGTAQVGVTLTATAGVWTNSPTVTRQWKADGANIASATATTYTPSTAEVGKVITVTESAVNAAGSATATSAGTAAVIAAVEDPEALTTEGTTTKVAASPQPVASALKTGKKAKTKRTTK